MINFIKRLYKRYIKKDKSVKLTFDIYNKPYNMGYEHTFESQDRFNSWIEEHTHTGTNIIPNATIKGSKLIFGENKDKFGIIS